MELKQHATHLDAEYILLLIVPYGIETSQTRPDHQTNQAFNRTLWN